MILEPCTTSGEKSADGVIYAAPALLCSIVLMPPSSGVASLVIYDNASAASGTVLWEVQVDADKSISSQSVTFPMPIRALKGIYVDLTGTAKYLIGFYPTF